MRLCYALARPITLKLVSSSSSQVSATFAASLVTSPAIGAYLSAWYGDNLVVLVATLIALADICFIVLAVPESLPDKMRLNTWGAPISWEHADPFAVSILMINNTVIGWNNKITSNERAIERWRFESLALIEGDLIFFLSLSVSEEGGAGLNSFTNLYHCVPVLPARGWTVL